jgi:hypothetical protein
MTIKARNTATRAGKRERSSSGRRQQPNDGRPTAVHEQDDTSLQACVPHDESDLRHRETHATRVQREETHRKCRQAQPKVVATVVVHTTNRQRPKFAARRFAPCTFRVRLEKLSEGTLQAVLHKRQCLQRGHKTHFGGKQSLSREQSTQP